MEPNIICLIETHLLEGNNIKVEGYSWYGQNRKLKHIQAERDTGGIGILVKNSLYEDFNISIIDKQYERILAMNFEHKISHVNISVMCTYLPPENSIYGMDSSSFFSHLISLTYETMSSDLTLICGDLNARIGNKCDYIPDIDDIPPRNSIDDKVNNHGETLIEFLKDVKMCALNGRLTPELDNYTCISTRGRSIVDYVLVPHECLRFCKKLEVIPVNSLIDKLRLTQLISHKSKPPDHSMVIANIMYSYRCDLEETGKVEQSYTQSTERNERRRMYCFDTRPQGFMQNKMW